jgi:predicted permease
MNISCHIIIALVSLYPFSDRLDFFTSTQMASCYLNYVIIGLPIFTSIWGDESAKVAVICPFVHYVFMLPLYLILTHLLKTRKSSDSASRGITLRDVAGGFVQSLKTPLIGGAFAGLIWSATGITPPIFFARLSSYVGNVVVVISLLGIGSFLYANSIFACHILQLLFCLALRFVIGPTLSAIWAVVCRFPPTLARQCTVLGAMPTSTVAYVVAVSTGVGVGATSSVVFWSVALVVSVVMLWFYILDSLGMFIEQE